MVDSKSHEDKFLDGELLFVPDELKHKVDSECFRIERQELTYLIWAAVKSAPAERRSSRKRIQHKRFNYESSYSTDHTALLWLAENGFVELDKANSYYADPAKGFPKKYRLISKNSPNLIELIHKSLVRGPEPYTKHEVCCRYTREILDRLEVDRDGLKQELRHTICEYHQLENLTRSGITKREKTRIRENKTTVIPSLLRDFIRLGCRSSIL